MFMNQMLAPASDSRSALIVTAALGRFMAYGFARVTMDDIAQSAGMSRPALYQFFRNKQQIYEAGATAMREKSLAVMAQVLEQPGSSRARIAAAMGEGVLDMMAQMEATPHGAELISMSTGMPPGWMAEWRQRKQVLLAPVYEEAGVPEPFSGAVLAEQLSDFVEGMKSRLVDPDARRAALERFLDLQFAAIG